LEQVAAKTESGVRNAEAALSLRIDGWDDEEKMRQKSRALLATSSSAFQSYKMAHCELDASSAAGGNGAGDLRLMCVIALNRQYIKKLNMEAQWFEPAHAQPGAAPEKSAAASRRQIFR
jgi:hypothetical protein